jgi:hypothetical protein
MPSIIVRRPWPSATSATPISGRKLAKKEMSTRETDETNSERRYKPWEKK